MIHGAENTSPSSPGHRKPWLGGRISVWNLALLLLALVSATLFVVRCLRFEGLWYDESVQYWISRGIDAFSPPFQKPGNVADVMHHNARGNLDPGGYSILLHFWLMMSRTLEWQRLLPLLFFALGSGCLAWLGWRWRRSFKFALLAGLVPAVYPVLRDHANEARAYSMELAAIVIACLTLDVVLTHRRRNALLIGGLVIGLFFWSRYSFVLVAMAVTGAFATYCLLEKKTLSARLAPIAWFVLPMVVLGVLVLWLGFYPQYRDRISWENGALVRYLDVFKASHATTEKVMTNLFHPIAWPLTVIPLLVLSRKIWRRRGQRAPLGSEQPLAPQYLVALFTIIITAAVWKWHPWAVAMKWGNYLQALSAVTLVRVAADLLALVERKDTSRVRFARFEPLALTCAITVACVLMIRHDRKPWTHVPELIRFLDKLNPKREEVSVIPNYYPTLRYYYEDGPARGSKDFPRIYRLPYWGANTPLIWKRTRYLVSDLPLQTTQSHYLETTILSKEGLPKNLYLVEKPTAPDSSSAAPPPSPSTPER
ncbi:hypothetical protein [Roseimicrobium gellanilyticum]|nr:hypothetical protein [Roseimicrobium gellanilyticum]